MIDIVQILENGFLEWMYRAVQGAGYNAFPSQSLIKTALCAEPLCAPPAPIVLPMSAAGFVAACQGSPCGWQDQFPGTQVKDFPRPDRPNARSTNLLSCHAGEKQPWNTH
ncbi:hypothetical protein [Pseudomonas fluorescens]|uniref:hypothetical protein n=1 Tax=Pseudomonas fluorescens TaxID=294 RepID=UPI0012D77629|nr:hypothetical protein [Pseudomonas fluorescens]